MMTVNSTFAKSIEQAKPNNKTDSHVNIQTTSETSIENKRGTTINGVSVALVPQDPESEDELIAKKYKK